MAASNYRPCLKEVLKHEGGYINHPKDPGGETNFGVTKVVAREFGYTGPMRAIPMDVVENIYRNQYWRSGSGDCDKLVVGVDLATFDFAVNSGPARAWKYLRASVGGDAISTIKTLCAKRMGFLQGLGTWATFGKGWARRVAGVEAVGVKMNLAAGNLSPEAVSKELKKESDKAAGQQTSNGKKATGTATIEAAKDGGTATGIDVTQFDWTAWLMFGAITFVLLGLLAFFIWKWKQHKERAEAYEAAASEV
jgi:lysozyme family protein